MADAPPTPPLDAIRATLIECASSESAPPPRKHKQLRGPGAIIGFAFAVALLLVAMVISEPDAPREWRDNQTQATTSAITSRDFPHRVTYTVVGAGRAALTYENESGGTEQKTVDLPWELKLTKSRGKFLYLSAQKQQEGGIIAAMLYVDGTLVQSAESNSAYGIASVRGTVPSE